jgi:hypothetical protein
LYNLPPVSLCPEETTIEVADEARLLVRMEILKVVDEDGDKDGDKGVGNMMTTPHSEDDILTQA